MVGLVKMLRVSRHWGSNPRLYDSPSSSQPTVPQEYSGSEADVGWPGAYHTTVPFLLLIDP